jgi:hypothetical protein
MHITPRSHRFAIRDVISLAIRLVPRGVVGVLTAAVLVLATPRPAAAQAKPVAIDPGMTKDQVVERLGEPSEESHTGSFTYMMYDNECGQKCGMDDLVVLERGIVTDAVFRSGKRRYTGQSSSPSALQPAAPTHFAPAPIRASTPDDSAHRGGIVLMGPRPPARPSSYVRVVPTHADSARIMGSGPKPDSASPAPHE